MNIGSNVILSTLEVPIINTFEQLCENLSISHQSMYVLIFKKEYCYYEKRIPKKDGTERILNVPNLLLKVVQRWILKEILEKIKISSQAMAFVPQINGLKKNAICHKKNIFLLEMDITNFFGSITEKQVKKLFSNIGYNSKIAGFLASLCTYNGVLPQGAVTSPYIANLTCFHLDARINNYCSMRDVVYTRYADDLTFSSNNRVLLNRIEKFIKCIIQDEGFLVNENKTRYLSNDVKKTVTGITINDSSIHVDKNFKRILRAQIYNSIKNKDYTCNDQILGKIAYINSIEEGYKNKMIKYVQYIINKKEFASDRDVVTAFNSHKLFSEIPDMKYR